MLGELVVDNHIFKFVFKELLSDDFFFCLSMIFGSSNVLEKHKIDFMHRFISIDLTDIHDQKIRLGTSLRVTLGFFFRFLLIFWEIPSIIATTISEGSLGDSKRKIFQQFFLKISPYTLLEISRDILVRIPFVVSSEIS